tara:strand:+ start:63 stop:272 length:210 start_codon:yes stop_codon:yes gene_type:complete
MSDPIKNSVDEQFIDDLKKNCLSPFDLETTAQLIQKYIKELVQHEIDVITDSDWFDFKIENATRGSKDD